VTGLVLSLRVGREQAAAHRFHAEVEQAAATATVREAVPEAERAHPIPLATGGEARRLAHRVRRLAAAPATPSSLPLPLMPAAWPIRRREAAGGSPAAHA
jgi:hypothetical protein